ncbi:hypothetical protein [Portibacter marinus]|uniref:hypothetical protein n=1 Tax=Portibacter marinus TaxID=2898660 RepID=UPI001F3034A8|nr:hypothetical protein [Portibacter marinus]
MKTYITKFFLLVLLFASCKTDQTQSNDEITEEKVEDLAEDLLAEELADVDGFESESAQGGGVGNEVEVKLEEVSVDQEKLIEQKREILKEQLKESPNLGKDCESILKEYAELVDKYVSGEDKDAVIKRLAEWANDPIYNKCKKDDAYKDRFYQLEEKMYADEEEEF